MKKKKISLVAGIILGVMILTALGAIAALQTDELITEDTLVAQKQAIESLTQTSLVAEYAEAILNNKSELSYEEFNDLFNYVDYLVTYNPTQDERTYIISILKTGIGMADLSVAYSFWKTTKEDITFLGSLKEHIYKFPVRTSDIENAYEKIRRERGDWCSVDRQYYKENGVSDEDIYAARILERRQDVLSADEILQKVVKKEKWKDIISSSGAEIAVDDVSSTDEMNGLELFNAENVSKRVKKIEQHQKKSLKILSKSKEYTVAEMKDALGKALDKRSININNIVFDLGYRVGEKYMDEEERTASEQILAVAKSNGLSDNEIIYLKGLNYSTIDILNLSYLIQSGVKFDMAINKFKKEDK